MLGEIRRQGSFTLAIDWMSAEAELDCDGCLGTIDGEAWTLSLQSGPPVVLCGTCVYELKEGLVYAMS